MRRALIALFVLTLAALAANVKLYLKDGGFHLVREYQVQTDRVRYYSVERSQWEEMPLDLVDLKRTESEMAERQAQLADETKVVAEEEKAVHEARAEVAKIPQDPGVYYVILRSMFAVGVIDNPPRRQVVDIFKGLEDAQALAEESIVLLKNSGNQIGRAHV